MEKFCGLDYDSNGTLGLYLTCASDGLDINKVADEIFLTEDVRNIATELGLSAPTDEYKIEKIMGQILMQKT